MLGLAVHVSKKHSHADSELRVERLLSGGLRKIVLLISLTIVAPKLVDAKLSLGQLAELHIQQVRHRLRIRPQARLAGLQVRGGCTHV